MEKSEADLYAQTLDELDLTNEEQREALSDFAAVYFSNEISNAIRAVGDISDVTNARIMADTHVATAKIASSAEIHAAALVAAAETLFLSIQKYEHQGYSKSKLSTSILMDLSQKTETDIKDASWNAIGVINMEAQEAVSKITEAAKQSINDINKLSAAVEAQIEENARLAEIKLNKAKLSTRTLETIKHDAEVAADKIVTAAASTTQKLKKMVSDTMSTVRETAESASESIATTVTVATERIMTSRDKAIGRIEAFLKSRMN